MRTRQDILADVEDAIREILTRDYRDGANDYAYVRVHADGDVTSGREPSYCVPESEYYGRPGHPVTVWSVQGMRSPAGFESGVFEWEEVEAPTDLTPEEIKRGFRDGGRDGEDLQRTDGTWYRLTDTLLNPIDLTDVMSDIERDLEEHDWFPIAQ